MTEPPLEAAPPPPPPPEASTPSRGQDGLLNLSAVRRRARDLGLQISPGAVEVLNRWAAEAVDGAALAVRTGGRRRVTATFMRRVLFK